MFYYTLSKYLLFAHLSRILSISYAISGLFLQDKLQQG